MVPCKYGKSLLQLHWLNFNFIVVRAQGLNNALEDARLYVDAIKGVCHENKDLKTSISAYDESAFTRGKADIHSSNDQMFSYHHWDSVMNGPLMRNGYSKNQ